MTISCTLRPFGPPLPAKPTAQTNRNPKHPTRFSPLKCLAALYAADRAKDLRVSWREELKRAFPAELITTTSAENWEEGNADTDGKFERLIDRRCVDKIRMLIVDSVQHAKAGHPGIAMGMAEVGYHLFRHVMT